MHRKGYFLVDTNLNNGDKTLEKRTNLRYNRFCHFRFFFFYNFVKNNCTRLQFLVNIYNGVHINFFESTKPWST